MDRSIARVGGWAGALAVVGIFGYHLALMVIAGQRVSGTTDSAAITAYYQHPGIALLSVEQFAVLVPMLVFAIALRETLSISSSPRFLATIGLVALIVEVAVLLPVISAQAALVSTAQTGGDVVGLFRFWDVLYNSGAYALEATWVATFGLAMRGAHGFPRWLPRFSYVTSALLAINVTAIWIGIPDAATLPSALFIGIWLGAASFGLSRVGAVGRPAMVPAAA